MALTNLQPSPAEFARLAAQGNLVPVWADLFADLETPVSVYAKLRSKGPAFLLESVEGGAVLNRYSFIGCNPRKVIRVKGSVATITTRDGAVTKVPRPADPLTLVENELKACRPVKVPGMPRFTGGAVGFLSYEYVGAVEKSVPAAKEDPQGAPELHFLITDSAVIFDRARQTVRLLVNARIEGDIQEARRTAVAELEELFTALQKTASLAPAPVVDPGVPEAAASNLDQATFEANVLRAQEYIKAGDIIQVVLSQRFEKKFNRPPLDLYRALRTVNPSPYMFLYEAGDFALVGASPEVHVRLTDGRAEIRPIAGTRTRGATPEQDVANEKDLLADAKERAEHLMLVDLARNDLGRVCDYGSVTVPEFMIIERYSHVMHIVSQVEGHLRPDRNAFDLMRATFPTGTVSGAPKIRAMQIIGDMERDQRGPYAGVLGYFSHDGNLDSCIAIRTAMLKDGTVSVQAGAGIVADSVPLSEYQETINKAAGVMKAVALAERIPTMG